MQNATFVSLILLLFLHITIFFYIGQFENAQFMSRPRKIALLPRVYRKKVGRLTAKENKWKYTKTTKTNTNLNINHIFLENSLPS